MILFGFFVWTAVQLPHEGVHGLAASKPSSTQGVVERKSPVPTVVQATQPILAPETLGTKRMAAAPAKKVTALPPPIDDKAEEMKLCSLAVNGGSVDLVVRTLVAQSRLNLVLLGGKDTPVTLNLRSVPLIQAIHHLCVLGDLRFVRLPNTLAIGPEEVLKRSYAAEWATQYPAPIVPGAPPVVAPVTRIVRLAHISAIDAVATLDGLYKERGLVSIAAPKTMSPLLSAVETTTTGTAANGGVATAADGASRVVVLSGPAEIVAAAETLIISLDVPRAQVQIAVTMHDVSNAALRDLGVSWTFNSVTVTEKSDRSFLFGKFDRTNLGFNAVIHALETNDKAHLIASPNVSVLDGERGFVLIGDRLTFPELVGYSQANTPIFSTKQERVGVYLQVSATVSPDGYVTMTIAPQVSTVRGFLEVGGTSYPQISTREAQSTLRIKSGETIIMGGLMRDDEISNMERIPILADLPILGELFKRRKKQKSTSQLVISVTPTVVAP